MPKLKANLRSSLRRLRRSVEPAALAAGYHLLFDRRQERLYDALVRVRNATLGTLIRLEASSVCQLRCPVCSMARAKGHDPVVGWGVLRFEDFRRLIDDNPQIRAVELSNWGEIFLNPQLLEIMRYAFEKGVKLRAVNGVNLNRVSDEVLRGLVQYRFGQITVSLDGATHETYRLYRRRGSFHQVIANIERINELKRELGASSPKLQWQFIVFGHNEHEIEAARALAERLDMDFRPKLNHTPNFSPIKDKARVREVTGLGAASRDEFAARQKRAYSRPCSQLWASPQVNWDGKLLGCCANKFGDFGNVFELGLPAALASERYRYAKRMVLGLAPPREDIACVRCKVYRQHVLGETVSPGRGHSADPTRREDAGEHRAGQAAPWSPGPGSTAAGRNSARRPAASPTAATDVAPGPSSGAPS